MKNKKIQIPTGLTGVLLGSTLLFNSGCQYMPWYKKKDATAQDTTAPVGQPAPIQAPLRVDSAFNADFDNLEQTALTNDPYRTPSRPELPPVILEEPVQDPYIPDLSGTAYNDPVETGTPGFPQAEDDLTYIVQKGDTLWGISQNFKVSLNKLLSANNLTRTSLISVGQSLTIPGVSESTPPVAFQPAISYDAGNTFESSGEYTVKKGDHLTKIAYLYGTSVSKLKEANGLVTDRLMIGQKLVVPSGGQVNQSWQPSTAVSPSDSSVSVSASRASSGDYHVVRRGEYPGSIARMYGLKTSELMQLNNIDDPRKIQIGAKLLVRKNGSLPSSVTTLGASASKVTPSLSSTPKATLSTSSDKLDFTTLSFQAEEEAEGQLIPVGESPAVVGPSFEDVPVMTIESAN
jgi:LysM repeat protein